MPGSVPYQHDHSSQRGIEQRGANLQQAHKTGDEEWRLPGIYVEIDLERKAQMLEKTNALHSNPVSKQPWKENPSLMAFLRSL